MKIAGKLQRRIAILAGLLIVVAMAAATVQAGVGISHFDATPGPETAEITVSWETETEVDVTAFRLVRSTQPLVQTATMVAVLPAVGSGVGGASYEYIDSGLIAGQRYYYWLYEIISSGNVNLITQAVTAVAPSQPLLARRVFLPLANHSN